MKTTDKFRKASKMATALFAVFIIGTSVSAQQKLKAGRNDEVNAANARLEALMASTEEACKYEAASDEYNYDQAAYSSMACQKKGEWVVLSLKMTKKEIINAIPVGIRKFYTSIRTKQAKD